MSEFAGLTTTKRRWAAIGMVVVIGVAGCGGDEKLAVGEVKEGSEAYCEKSLAIDTYPDPDIDFRTATPEQITAATKQIASGIRPLAEQASAVSPPEIKSDIEVLVAAVKKVEQTGDFTAFESDPAVSEAEQRVDTFNVETCGYGQAEVIGKDYEFEGLPEKSEAGNVSFDFSNVGKEPHELIVFRVNDGVDESIDELLNLPEEEASTKVKLVGGTGPIDPGATEQFIGLLTPGTYGAVCFIPVGGGEEGPPHLTRGMKGEFEVS